MSVTVYICTEKHLGTTNTHLNFSINGWLFLFQNLIINSIHSIQEANLSAGKIIVESSIVNNYLDISILDNGVGLKYEKNELIKPYFTTKKRRGGSGLGLAIVEKILFDHNAEFSIENRNDGFQGAKVEIKFDNKIWIRKKYS